MTKLFPWGEAKKVVSDELTETYDPEHYWVFYFKGNRPLLWLFLSSFSMICSSSPWEGEKKTASVMSDVKFNHHHIIIAVTVFQNYPKRRAFEFSRFWSACLVTLFDHKRQVFKNLPKIDLFGHFLARNVEWDSFLSFSNNVTVCRAIVVDEWVFE